MPKKGKYTTKTGKMTPRRLERMKKQGFTFKGSEPAGKKGTSDHYKLPTLSRTGTWTRENVPTYSAMPMIGEGVAKRDKKGRIKYKKPRRR